VIEVRGADQLGDLSRRLKAAGDKGMQRELYAAINRATKPMKEAVKRSAATELPRRGGLAETVAGGKFRTQRRTSKKASGVRIVATGKLDIRGMDRGRLRHPVFGNRSVWVTQQIAAGWWTRPLEHAAPAVRVDLEKAMDVIAKKIEG